MRWPWVSRYRLDLALQAIGRAQENRCAEINLLTRELDHYREKFELEKERADRAVDSLMQWAGREPISVPAREVQESQQKAQKEMTGQLTEIFGDVVSSVLGQDGEEVKEEEEAAPPGVTEEEEMKLREARLAVLRKLPRYLKRVEAEAKDKAQQSSAPSPDGATVS